tara:strand:- start:159 stop:437 length:279 start_codon:yes stop_codon:yes gene_type:complete
MRLILAVALPVRQAGNGGIAALVAVPFDLAEQALAGEVREGGNALTQISLERFEQAFAWLARAVDRSFEATADVFADGLAIEPGPLGNLADR